MNKLRLTPDRLVLISILLAAALYAPALRYDFILDDFPLILLNKDLDSWAQWHTAFTQHVWAFADPPLEPRHYRPVYSLWLLVNKQLFGGVTPWWHLTSLLLHLIATTLVYRVSLRLVSDEWTSAIAASLFALHPVHMESVVWISASTDLLAASFVLGAFLCYLRFRESGSLAMLAASVACAGVAILCKETAAVFPAVILAHEFLGPGRAETGLTWKIWRVIPFAVVVVLYMLARKIAIPNVVHSATDASLGTVILSLPLVAAAYAKSLIWPLQLSFFYAPEAASTWSASGAIAVFLLMALLFATLRLAKRIPEARLPLAWFIIFSAPPLAAIAVFTRDNWVHDRHMYLPSVGFCLLLALAIVRLPSFGRRVSLAMIGALFLVGIITQLPALEDEITVYAHAMGHAPTNLEMRLAYAYALNMRGRQRESIQEYELIAKMAPDSTEAFVNLGMMYEDLGRAGEAQAAFQQAVIYARPGSGLQKNALFHLGEVELKLDHPKQAEDYLRQAIKLDPVGWNYHALLAESLRRQGRSAEAEEEMHAESAARQQALTRRTTPRQ